MLFCDFINLEILVVNLWFFVKKTSPVEKSHKTALMYFFGLCKATVWCKNQSQVYFCTVSSGFLYKHQPWDTYKRS